MKKNSLYQVERASKVVISFCDRVSIHRTQTSKAAILRTVSRGDYAMKSKMRLIKSALEYRSLNELIAVPKGVRGVYALYMKRGGCYDMVYIGMSGKGANGRIRSRLIQHSQKKAAAWTHFSYYEVWDNISDLEIKELEGIFRQLYRFDSRANNLNKQVTHRQMITVRKETERELGLTPVSWKSLGVRTQ